MDKTFTNRLPAVAKIFEVKPVYTFSVYTVVGFVHISFGLKRFFRIPPWPLN